VLIVLIFGMLYGGIAYNRQLALTQSAREGARFGATLPLAGGADAPDDAWFAQVLDRIEESSTGSLVTGQPGRYICIRFVSDTGTPVVREYGTGDCTVDSSSVVDRERVEVVVGRPANLDLVLYDFPLNLRANSIARYEGRIGS
jgi:Flp pilus assembly protein TadG